MYLWHLFWKVVTAVMLIGLVVWALSGCAGVGYAVSVAGAGHTQYKFKQLEERVTALENGDIW